MIIERIDGKWTHTGTVSERVYVLNMAHGLYTESKERTKWRKRMGYDLGAITKVWESGLFTLSALEEVTGVSRKTLRTWLGLKGRVERPRGRIVPGHMPALVGRLTAERGEESMDTDKFIVQLVEEGSTEVLVRALLQVEEDSGTNGVRRAHRPNDQGHPAVSEELSTDHYSDSDDHGPGDSQEQPVTFDAGLLQEPAARDEAPEPSPAEDQGIKPVDAGVDDQGRAVVIDAAGTEIVGDDWDPLEGFEFDESGDSLLLGGDDEEAGRGIPGLPDPGAPWEQAEEA